MMELLFEGLYNMIEDLIGHGAGRRFLPLIGSFAVFIFLSNLTGGIFFLQPPDPESEHDLCPVRNRSSDLPLDGPEGSRHRLLQAVSRSWTAACMAVAT